MEYKLLDISLDEDLKGRMMGLSMTDDEKPITHLKGFNWLD